MMRSLFGGETLWEWIALMTVIHTGMIAKVNGIVHYENSGGKWWTDHVPDEQRLFEKLLADYEPAVRPVYNANDAVVVYFRLALDQIVDLDERKQMMTSKVLISQEWTDEQLRWNASDYGGVKTLRINSARVWRPDTVVINTADDASAGYVNGSHVLLRSTGTVTWPAQVRVRSLCDVDMTYFPFDDQRCSLRFGSWLYPDQRVLFNGWLESVNVYMDNSEWKLLDVSVERRRRLGVGSWSESDNEVYTELLYTVRMRRRCLYYVFNVIVPCVMLSCLTLVTFWVPSNSREKIAVGLSVFLTFSMFTLLVADVVPTTSQSLPLISIYMMSVMTLTSLSVIMAVFVINCYNSGHLSRRAPLWARSLVLGSLSAILHMSHDTDRMAANLRLPTAVESRYLCRIHQRSRQSSNLSRGASTTDRCDDAHHNDNSVSCERHDVDHKTTSGRRSMTSSMSYGESAAAYPDELLRLTLNDSDDDKPEADTLRSQSSRSMSPQQYSDTFDDVDRHFEPQTHTFNDNVNNRKKKSKTKTRRRACGSYTVQETLSPEDDITATKIKRERTTSEPHLVSGTITSHDDVTRRGRKTKAKRDRANVGLCIGPKTPSSDANEVTRQRRRKNRNGEDDETAAGCGRARALYFWKRAIVEWRAMSAVIDRLLFLIFLVVTLAVYLVIFVAVPLTKWTPDGDGSAFQPRQND